MVPLGEIATPIERAAVPLPGTVYRQVGVKLWGQGAYERETLDGAKTSYKTLSRVEAGDIIVNKIWARNGSVAVIPESLAGGYVSGEFPTFLPATGKLDPRWFHWFTKTHRCWEQCDEKSRGTSGKNRIRPELFLEIRIPLPRLSEQRGILARIEQFAAKIQEARHVQLETALMLQHLLHGAYSRIIAGAPLRLMAEVAPLVRRPVQVNLENEYLELGIRSFGKGTFHKASAAGATLGTKRIFNIKPGDLLFNIVFAWEGAVAVAKKEDDGRVGSHRFLTCVAKEGVATADYLCFHFLTDNGLEDLGRASPGGAGRNRTLGLEALSAIQVPVPSYGKQLGFDTLQAKVDALKKLQTETAAELDALLPSIVDRAFKGEL
jgi:type I restriction enzyme S subunit